MLNPLCLAVVAFLHISGPKECTNSRLTMSKKKKERQHIILCTFEGFFTLSEGGSDAADSEMLFFLFLKF
jgi:azurin